MKPTFLSCFMKPDSQNSPPLFCSHFSFSRSLSLCRVKKISASDNDGKQDWYSVPVPESSGTSLQVTGLSPATDYQFSVLSHNKMGTGPFSEIATARTMGQYNPRFWFHICKIEIWWWWWWGEAIIKLLSNVVISLSLVQNIQLAGFSSLGWC